MKGPKSFVVVAGLATAAWVGTATAHHSFAAAYDTSPAGAIEITGTIVNVRLTNPHSFFFLDVPGTPGGMLRNGYSPDIIKVGDTVTITGFRAHDKSKPNGMLRQLTTADGTVFGMFGPQEGAGAR